MTTCKKISVNIALIALISIVAAGLASATTVFSISDPNPGIAGFPGPYASVTVSLTDSTDASVTFTSLASGSFFYLMGDGGTAALNVNGPFTVGPVTESNSLGPPFTPTFGSTGSGTEDGFGSFNFQLTNFDGFFDSASSISFVLTRTSGTWSSSDNVLTPNAGGFSAAAHIFVESSGCTDPSTGALQACATGFAADGGGGGQAGGEVIEAGTMFLSLTGLGLIVLGATRRKKALAPA